MKSKLFIAAMAMILATTGITSAQQTNRQRRDCDQVAKNRTEILKKEVNLDAKQEKAALEIYTKHCKENQDQNQTREAMMKLRVKTDKEIKAILTPEQIEKWEVAKTKRNTNRGQGRPNNGLGNGPRSNR